MGFFDSVKHKAGILVSDAERAGKVTAAQARLVVLQNDLKKAERELGRAVFALAELGELGALDRPELAQALERVRAAAMEARAKEAEIAALRGEAPPQPETRSPATVAATAEAVSATAVPASEAAVTSAGPGASDRVTPPAATTIHTAAGPVTVAPAQVLAEAEAARAAATAAAGVEPDAPSDQPAGSGPAEPPKPRTTRRAPDDRPATSAGKKSTGKKAAGTTAATRKAVPKAAVAKKAPAKRTAAKQAPGTLASDKGGKAGSTPKKTPRPSSAGPRPGGKKRPAGS
ncbi:MAG: hypothetical protein GX624_04865 [Actinobacteria bacterium]|nr:hypothetical protein [Actinomycetota bacterium]